MNETYALNWAIIKGKHGIDWAHYRLYSYNSDGHKN